MVVDRLQVRLVAQVGGDLHLVEARVEILALVHDRQGLRLDRVEQVGGVGERRDDALGAEDRQAVTRQHDLGSQGRHLAQRRRPVGEVALHLLRVAGVGDRPDEEVAGVEDLALGHVGPRGVVGLAAGVMQFERELTARERELLRVGDVGIAVLARPRELRHVDRELATVDRRVPAAGLLVAPEVGRHLLVGVHDRAGPAVVGGLRVEQRRAEHVVDVVVGVDGCGQGRRGSPPAHGLEHGAPVERAAGVEHHEPVAGVECVDRCDRLQRQQAVLDLLGRRGPGAVVVGLVDRLDGVMGVDQFASPLPVLLGQFADRRHGRTLRQPFRRRPRRSSDSGRPVRRST